MEEQRQPLTIAQRQKKARQMKRLAPRLARFRKIKAKRKADKDTLMKRAQKAARNVVRKKVAGDRGKNYSALSPSEKVTIDKLVAKKSAIIKRMAKKLLPQIRKAEMERLKQARGSKNEEFDLNEAFEAAFMIEKKDDDKEAPKKTPQDPDVKDLPGTQPKKYYKGLSDKEKEARAKQFARQTKKDDDDPSAYKAPPSNKDAKTKPSKHTKKYHQMFGEGAVEDTRERHKREKEALRQQHDSEMDAARLQDAREKNQQTESFEINESAKAGLQKKADKSGIPYSILKKVYDRGMAAWRTGHRPGATQQQWAYARVNSFLTGGGARKSDNDLWQKAKKSKKSKKESVELDEILKKEGSKWVLYSKDGSKKLGEFDTKEDALKRERQIQYFKHQNEEIELDEAVSPAQQAAIAISKKERGKKPKNEDDFKPHMMYDPETGESELAKVPADHERLSKKGYTHEKPKKNLKAMLGIPKARPTTQFGEETNLEEVKKPTTAQIRMARRLKKAGVGKNDDFYLSMMDPETRKKYEPSKRPPPMKVKPPKGKTFNWLRREEVEDAGEIKYGNYQTRHFDMCPAATALYKDMEVTDKGMRSVKLQDSLFQMEKEVIEKDSATREDVMAAQNVADEIMAIAKMMGMEKEHGYIQGHVDKIKELATIDEMPRWLLEPLSKITRRRGYEAAKKVLADVLARKKKEAGRKGLQHSIEYYAAQIAKQFDGVDARVLADMVNESPEKMDAPEIGTDKIKKRYSDMTPGQVSESYVFAQDEIKIQGAFEHHPTTDFQEDYLGWVFEEETLEEAEYQGRKVKLNDPFRTPKGPKKFSVYVKNDKGNVIKVNFGDPDMEIKRDDPERRKAFRARHNCDQKTDKTKAGYWSCLFWSKGKVSDMD